MRVKFKCFICGHRHGTDDLPDDEANTKHDIYLCWTFDKMEGYCDCTEKDFNSIEYLVRETRAKK